jgi:protein-L-isoaspartate(D-aspartate) O-methyltransferase
MHPTALMESVNTSTNDLYATERRSMVESQLRSRGIHDERVLDAMLRVPRHEFVTEEYRSVAYADHPIPIGEGQTISQPFIVAVSLQALALKGTEKVLEVGTGSGYQTALLAILARDVYSIERHAALAREAEVVLAKLGFNNTQVIVGDGSNGLQEFAPYDAILVSAAAPSIPQSLFSQLGEGAGMVIPVGPPHAQELQLVRKHDDKPAVEVIEGCRFVPLIGAEGY